MNINASPLAASAPQAVPAQVVQPQAAAPNNIFSTLNFAQNFTAGQLSLIGKIVLVVSCVAYLFTLPSSSPEQQKFGHMAQEVLGGIDMLAKGISGLSNSSQNVEKAATDLQKSVVDASTAAKNLYDTVAGVATPIFNLFSNSTPVATQA